MLLVSPPSVVDEVFMKGRHLFNPAEPLGLLYIASSLLRENRTVKILDCNGEGLSTDRAVEKIIEINPFILGISCLTPEARKVETLLERVRDALPETVVVMGNLHARYFHEYYLRKNLAHIVVHGEGELVMPEIVRHLRERRNPDHIKGISYLDDGDRVKTTPPEPIADLDSLPPPAWHLVDVKNYRSNFYYNFNPTRTRMMVTSRGCPVGCSFCVIHDDRRVRHHGAKRIIEEILFLKRTYGTTHINFQDAMFLHKPAKVMEICDAMTNGGIDVSWACEAHVNFVREELFERMKEAGCGTVFFGLEAGDDGLLERIGKKSTVESNQRAVRIAHQAGINPIGFFMLGLPGESEDLTRKTIEFALSLPLDMVVFSITIPLPGSRMYEEHCRKNSDFDVYDWDGYNNTGVFGSRSPALVLGDVPYERLARLQSWAMRRFHFRPRILWRHIKSLKYATMSEVKSLFDSAWMVLARK